LVGKFVLLFPASGGIIFVILVAKAGIFVNAILMVFNLFPLLPLDGGRILAGLLPARASYLFGRTEPYGMFILVGLILTGVMGAFLWPLVDFFMNTVYSILNLR
ncbi:MAG: site-2 protease family protein, partial [Rhodocyclaceae bacterium]|nr:site-2 protease family protein [Rhodocyclaceae bacterium]